MQCSVLATLEKPNDAVLNLSTSAQLAFVMPSDYTPVNHPGIVLTGY